MADIYDQHDAAFRQVSAYVVLKDGERVATVAFKFPKDGAGRLWAYVHWLGVPMVRGKADGFGYDKRSAAVAHAIPHIELLKETRPFQDVLGEIAQEKFIDALREDGGEYWDDRLRKAGFVVVQAV